VRKIGVVTVGRSDYGIYRPVLRELAAREVDLQLFVGGAHLLERFGPTVHEIEHDGFPIVARVDMLDEDDSPIGVAGSIGRGVIGFSRAFERARPDILLLLGDRFEMFAAGIAALPLTIPVAHLHGGDRTEGLIDEAIRHSLTKLSHLHFVATDEYAKRVIQLGEESWRVLVTGAPALDAVRELQPMSDVELEAMGLRLRGPTLLVTYHPVTLSWEEIGPVLDAIDRSGLDAIFTYPNADARYGSVIEELTQFVARSDRYSVVPSLGQRAYFSLMGRAAAIVGNSSSGLIEAASFELPVVDIGTRQEGRLRPRNVLHVESASDSDAILATIEQATSAGFRESLEGAPNPYGDGHASPRIVERLIDVPLDDRLLIKRFQDL
jgi:UDP-N-acetylglucosamine 2-epimerase (non-hydrolysing)/GDP/UDP-N,N'-diacetylbacillosamine 2-epimerase (hydrolysing)